MDQLKQNHPEQSHFVFTFQKWDACTVALQGISGGRAMLVASSSKRPYGDCLALLSFSNSFRLLLLLSVLRFVGRSLKWGEARNSSSCSSRGNLLCGLQWLYNGCEHFALRCQTLGVQGMTWWVCCHLTLLARMPPFVVLSARSGFSWCSLLVVLNWRLSRVDRSPITIWDEFL